MDKGKSLTVDDLVKMDATQPMSTNTRKRIKKAKRQVIGYDDTEPQMCCNCDFFKNALHAKRQREYFPSRCEKYEIEVARHAVCDHWEDK